MNVKIFFTSGDLKSMIALSGLEEFMDVFKQHITFEVHFIVEKKTYASKEWKNDHCYGDGKYCGLVDPGRRNRMDGKDIIDEDLRQSAIYEADKDKWFEYLKIFADCENNIEKFTETTKCSEEVGLQSLLGYESAEFRPSIDRSSS